MARGCTNRLWRAFTVTVVAVCVTCVCSVSGALASPGAGWEVFTNTHPTYLPPGGRGHVQLEIFNIGAGVPSGKLTVTDVLPPGLTEINAGEPEYKGSEGVFYPGIWTRGSGHQLWECSGTHVVTCTSEPGSPSFPVVKGGAGAGAPLRLEIAVKVAPEPGVAGTFPNRVTVAGGGAVTPAVSSHPLTISSGTPGFGFTNWDVWFGNEDGTVDTQAGSHPYSATFAFDLATAYKNMAECVAGETQHVQNQGEACKINKESGGEINTIVASLPPGLLRLAFRLRWTRRALPAPIRSTEATLD